VLVVAVVVISLVAVAIPVCLNSACASSSSAMPAMPSHMSVPQAFQGLAKVACDMALGARNALDAALPWAASGLLTMIAAVVALSAMAAFRPLWSFRRMSIGLDRSLSPPGDLQGVCLLI